MSGRKVTHGLMSGRVLKVILCLARKLGKGSYVWLDRF